MTKDDASPFGAYSAEDIARFQGFVLRDGRRGGFCWDEKPRCVGRVGEPFSHRIRPKDAEWFKNFKAAREGIVRCHHRLEAGGIECNALLYVVRLSLSPTDHALFVVELREDQREMMGSAAMKFLETLQLIDVALPGVGLDIGVPSEVDDPETLKRRRAEEAERRAKGGS